MRGKPKLGRKELPKKPDLLGVRSEESEGFPVSQQPEGSKVKMEGGKVDKCSLDSSH